jgi:hypothetical protein
MKNKTNNTMKFVMAMNKFTIISILFLLSACSDDTYVQTETNKEISAQLEANDFKSINFSELGSNKWTKVCFLGPYNENSEKALGFNWQVAEHTDVLKSDGHNVIVFATETEIIEYSIHSRGDGDFWKISGEVFTRDKSTLIKNKESGSWRYYVPK